MSLDKAKVARATVRFLKQGGQGVIVPGGLIVTAAHVITWDGTGAMAQGDRYVEEVEVGGQKILAQVYAAEPVSDIAVLGAVDEPAHMETGLRGKRANRTSTPRPSPSRPNKVSRAGPRAGR